MLFVLVLSLPFVFILFRRPVLRRLALRNAIRRPREAMFVILGSLFGTAIITGSLVVGDTIESSVRSLAYTSLGPIDEVVVAPQPAAQADVLARIEADRPEAIDGLMSFAALPVATAAGEPDALLAVPRSQMVELDFEAARRFGDDPESTGIVGETPAPGHAVITDKLAERLEVESGDELSVFAYNTEQRFIVDRVIPAKGLAGFSTGFFNQRSRNVLVGPGTFDALTQGAGADLAATRFAPPEYLVAISNRGGVEDGAVHTDAVVERVERALEPVGLTAVPIKQDVLDDAAADSREFEELFGAMGAFGILAGILLLVNIFVMLGEERKQELGMLRAVGLRRASLVGAFSTEGWLYSLFAAAAGTVVGLGLGRVIILGVERIFSADLEGFGIPLRFHASISSLQTGLSWGFAIAVVTVVLTSIRISRFNVIQAIRDLPEQRAAKQRRIWFVAGAVGVFVGALATVSSVSRDAPGLRLVGPVILALGFGPLLTRWLGMSGVSTAVSVAVLLWGAVVFPLTSTLGEAGIDVFVLQGIILTAAAVVFVSQQHHVLERFARRLGVGRWAMATRLGLAYPVARRFRTGLTLAMYSLVIFTLTFITTLTATFQDQVDNTSREISGGYDVFVSTNSSNPPALDELVAVNGVEAVGPVSRVEADFIAEGSETPVDWSVTGFDEQWLAQGPPELQDLGDYGSQEEAYRAVLADPTLILTDQFFLQEGGGPPEHAVRVGDTITMINDATGDGRTVTVAAQAADDFLFNGALYGMPGMRSFFGERAVFNRFYVDAADNADPKAVSAAIAGAFIAQGADADPIRDVLAQFIALQTQFFRLFQGYLGFGLLVGIAGLGVVMVRAVRERRREIGVLRSLGFESGTVRRSFVLEAAFVAMEGTLIGVVLALITGFNVMSNTDAFGDSAQFIIPFVGLAVIMGATLVASLLATAAPTRAAARIRPAVALRIAD